MNNTTDFRELLAEHLRRSETIRAGMTARNRAGVPTGPVPLGYKKVRRDDGSVTVVVDEETAPLVREAFRLAGMRRQSLRKIVRQLDEKGLVSRHGKPLTATALSRILTNEFYAGVVSYGGEQTEGRHEPLVSTREFETTQISMRTRNHHRKA